MATRGHSSGSSMSNHTKERVTMTKVTLENFYSNLIAQHEEREMRYVWAPACMRGQEAAVRMQINALTNSKQSSFVYPGGHTALQCGWRGPHT